MARKNYSEQFKVMRSNCWPIRDAVSARRMNRWEVSQAMLYARKKTLVPREQRDLEAENRRLRRVTLLGRPLPVLFLSRIDNRGKLVHHRRGHRCSPPIPRRHRMLERPGHRFTRMPHFLRNRAGTHAVYEKLMPNQLVEFHHQHPYRPLAWACATSHALVMREDMEFCGPEGVFIVEDDCVPLLGTGANEILRRIQTAAAALPGVEVIAGHEPASRYTFSEQAGGAVRIIKPPWGSMFTWYSLQGLRRAYEILTRMEVPMDWLWRDLAAKRMFALLTPPVAGHDGETTYIGNEHRGVKRAFVG